MNTPPEPSFTSVGFYVRESRTLVVASTARRVGGPGMALWRGGWGLAFTAEHLRTVPPCERAVTLCAAFTAGVGLSPMTQDAIFAWQRTWKPPRVG